MCDDFHGTYEWEVFTNSMKRVFPDRAIVDLENSDQIFHTLYDLDERYQVPGALYLETHQTYEHQGKVPHWRGIYDNRNRVMAAICSSVRRRPATNSPYPGSGFQGGIVRRWTAAAILFARGRASAKVSTLNGAAPPGRWHDAHC